MEVGDLSASKLATFFTCALQYHAKYELKLREPQGDAAKFGSAFHKIMELLVQTKKCPDINAIATEHGVTEKTSDLVKLTKSTLTNGYLDNFKNIDGVEKKFDMIIRGTDTKVRGVIDRLDLELDKNYAMIIDLKTSNHAFTKKELAANIQAKIYAAAIKRMYPNITKIDMIFWFVKSQKRQLVEFNDDTIEIVEKELTDVVHNIKSVTNPSPCENKYCKYCVYYDKCPLFNRPLSANNRDGSVQTIVPSFPLKMTKSASDIVLEGI